MERTFKQELDLAVKNNINVYKLNIASEVGDFLVNSIWYAESDLEDGTMSKLFEDICNLVSHVYLLIGEHYSLPNIVEAVVCLHFECDVPIEEIGKYNVVNYIIDNLYNL